MWIGELISEYKIGNGVSLIIFAGIVSQLPQEVSSAFFNYNPAMLPTYIAFVVLSIIVIAGVVFVNEGERKIPVSYAKQVRGNKMYWRREYLSASPREPGGRHSYYLRHFAFALSAIHRPGGFHIFSGAFPETERTCERLLREYSALQLGLLRARRTLHLFLYGDYFRSAGNRQESSAERGFIPGIRPGEAAAEMVGRIVRRITLFGALFLGVIAVLPNLTQIFTGIQALTIGGTALLIVVAVALEIMKQIESQLTVREYEGIF